MNPRKRIGRYELPILDVIAIERRTGWRAWLKKGYSALLSNGRRIHFTEEEKKQFEAAIELHNKVIVVHGMCKSLGLRG
jgi:hypothetical protein